MEWYCLCLFLALPKCHQRSGRQMSNSSISEIPPLFSSLLAKQREKRHISILMHGSLLLYWSGITESTHSHLSCCFLSMLSHYTRCRKSVFAVKTLCKTVFTLVLPFTLGDPVTSGQHSKGTIVHPAQCGARHSASVFASFSTTQFSFARPASRC